MKATLLLTATALLSSAAWAQEAPQPQREASAAPAAPTREASAAAPARDASAAPEAATQQPAPTPSVDVGAIFDKLDVNHDGKLTPEEAQAHPTVASHFASADANGDGVVTKEEFLTAFKPAQ